MNNKIRGALFGSIIGDMVGIPYEFQHPKNIPNYDQIGPIPPLGYTRSWEDWPIGCHSDDGAQVLCLAQALIDDGNDIAADLSGKLRDWYYRGYMSTNGMTLDAGLHTQRVMSLSQEEIIAKYSDDKFSGNGSLMRTIPISLWYSYPPEIIEMASNLSAVTHPSALCRACCALYNLITYWALIGMPLQSSIDLAFTLVCQVDPSLEDACLKIKEMQNIVPTGSGFVVDSFWTAISAVMYSDSFKDAIRQAILFGNDTDTTACIAGGLAGAIYGYDNIPTEWIDLLLSKDVVENIATKLCNNK